MIIFKEKEKEQYQKEIRCFMRDPGKIFKWKELVNIITQMEIKYMKVNLKMILLKEKVFKLIQMVILIKENLKMEKEKVTVSLWIKKEKHL